MLERVAVGSIPKKPHTVFRLDGKSALYEECLTQKGFEGAYSILYHRHRPHEALPRPTDHGARRLTALTGRPLLRRVYRCLDLPPGGSAALSARTPLLFNQEVTVGFLRPKAPDPAYFVNSDADELFFVLEGSGLLRSVFGDLRYQARDYLVIPRGTLYRFVPDAVDQAWLALECKSGLGLPERYRNPVGQLRMDAPYSHRDFRKPELPGPVDEGIREVVVKRGEVFFGYAHQHSPLDVVGWDGTVYPFVFPILAFNPRVGAVHLPPSVHATFAAPGVLICSFVPRPLDFGEGANPCPYPHSSPDMDEVLLYANDAFASRRGLGPGYLSHHPAGIPHGPHPGAYETAPGTARTEELAVMLDCSEPLSATADAARIEDPGYHESFVSEVAPGVTNE